MNIKSCWTAGAVSIGFAVALFVGGCNHYRVTDLNSGKIYYTLDVDRYASGAAKFKDQATGSRVVVQNSEVKKITEQEYKMGLYGK